MKYVTYTIETEAGQFDTSDPFVQLKPTDTGQIITPQTRRHANRLEALLRVKSHNSRLSRLGDSVLWMMAVEIDLDTTPDIEAVWLQGEQGVLEASVMAYFRFLVPTLEEVDLMGAICGRSAGDWPEIELAITRIEWELNESLAGARERLAESLAAYRAELWRSAIVMLGCVAESVSRNLITGFERVIAPDDRTDYFRKKRAAYTTGQKFQVFEKFCRPDLYRLTGCQTLQETREAYRTIQRLRNHCGHPSAGNVTREDVAGCYGQLADFCQLVNRLSDHFDRLELGWLIR